MEEIRGKVSVIIPVYNAQNYIGRCVESVLGQTYEELEILLIDDGSKDESLSVCQEYAQKDKRIKVYHNENHGVSYTRNYGLNMATGEYIVFADADDWLEANYVEEMLLCLVKNHVSVVMCNYKMEYDSGEHKVLHDFSDGLIGFQEALHPSSEYFQCAVWGKLFKTEVLNNMEHPIRFEEDLKIGEDRLFWTKVVLTVGKIYVRGTVLYHYYMNSMGAVSSQKFDAMYTDYQAKKRIAALLYAYKELHEINVSESVYTAVSTLMIEKTDSDPAKVQELKTYVSKNIKVFMKNPYFKIKSKIKIMLMHFSIVRNIYKML